MKSSVKIVLLERIAHLGKMGDVVSVRPGFARNFLIPQHKALRATEDNIRYFEQKRSDLEHESLQKKTDAKSRAEILGQVQLVLVRQASDSGHLYGSVTARDISSLISEKFFPVSKSQIEIATPIKVLGIHRSTLVLHPEIHVPIILTVAQTTEEALKQLEASLKAAKKSGSEEPLAE